MLRHNVNTQEHGAKWRVTTVKKGRGPDGGWCGDEGMELGGEVSR